MDTIWLPNGSWIDRETFEALFAECGNNYQALMDKGDPLGFAQLFEQWKEQGLIE